MNAFLIGDPLDGRELRAWFQASVLHGPGTFLIYADGYEDYAEAMTAKLLREFEPPLVAELLLARGGHEALRGVSQQVRRTGVSPYLPMVPGLNAKDECRIRRASLLWTDAPQST